MAEQRTLDAERAELLPCPFCGSKDVEAEGWESSSGKRGPACDDCGATAESIGDWNRRSPPALDAEGLPPLPEPIDTLAAEDGFNVIGEQGVYTAEQVRQVQRDARVDAEREIGLLKMVCEQLKARLASADALIESMATKADRAQIARTSAPVGAPVGMVLVEPYATVIDQDNAGGNSTVDAWMKLDEPIYTADQVRQAQWMAHKNGIDAGRMIAELKAPASSNAAVAWAVTAPKGGIHKLSITRDSAERKAARWREEWPDNACRVRPLVFGDAAPTSASAQPPDGVEHASHNKENSDE